MLEVRGGGPEAERIGIVAQRCVNPIISSWKRATVAAVSLYLNQNGLEMPVGCIKVLGPCIQERDNCVNE